MKRINACLPMFGISLFALLLSSCEKVEPMRISNAIYSLELWSDWTFQLRQGYDTYVGEFTDGNEVIKVDCGELAFISLDNIQQTSETSYYEETIIDSHPVKIVKVIHHSGGTSLALYIVNEDTGEKAKAYVINPNNDERYIAIFRTFLFE